VEALASVVLLLVGITSVMTALGALTNAQRRAEENEDMHRLARQKYDEIVGLGTLTSGQTSGDFLDSGEKRFIWSADREPTGFGNLDSIKVDVARKWEGMSRAVEVQGLFCNPVPAKGSSQ
jgi:type II secretory pathway pseudopilin PulG